MNDVSVSLLNGFISEKYGLTSLDGTVGFGLGNVNDKGAKLSLMTFVHKSTTYLVSLFKKAMGWGLSRF